MVNIVIVPCNEFQLGIPMRVYYIDIIVCIRVLLDKRKILAIAGCTSKRPTIIIFKNISVL